MDISILHELVMQWAARYGLRQVAATGNYRGIIDGVCLDVGISDDMIRSHFFCPTASLVSQIASDFAGFTNLASSGVAMKSLKGILSTRKDDNGSCVLELTVGQLRSLNPEVFNEIPSLVAKDFHEFGASANGMTCATCTKPSPTQLISFNNQYQVICESCFDAMQTQAAQEPNAAAFETAVNWSKAVPVMLLSTVVLGIVWGLLQHPSIRLPFLMLVFLPMFGVVGHVLVVALAANGIDQSLRWVLIVSALVSILIGNVIGYGFVLADNQIVATWGQVILAYFQVYLPKHWESEAWYFAGGLAGVYFALGSIKPQSQEEMVKQL